MLDKIGIPKDKISEPVKRVIDRAIVEASNGKHAFLCNEHLLLAIAQIEWNFFSKIIGESGLKLVDFIKNLGRHLRTMAGDNGYALEVSPSTQVMMNLALVNANKNTRTTVELIDILLIIFEETNSVAISLIKEQGVEPKAVTGAILKHVKIFKEREARLKERFELPPFLKHFGVNLNQLAHQDKLPPVFFRDREIMQVMEILCHIERPNSVLIVGEPGVGKTAVAEGLARLIELEQEKVPIRLHCCQIVNLQMNGLVAGTMLRGMFEERVQNIFREVREHPELILFIDEFHTIVGAGSALAAPLDAADAIKKGLSRGEIRVIGSTTLSEYKSYIARDEALSRRFRIVHIEEPTLEQTRDILRLTKQRIERNYSVRIADSAINMAMDLAPRYMKHLRLPDKVIGWLDTASVKVEIEGKREVTAADVVEVISGSARIPKEMVSRDIVQKLSDLEIKLSKRVIGQRTAIEATAKTVKLNKGPLKRNHDRPDGVLLFLGPTGVGKTELAKALAEYFFGDDKRMIRIDMSEYQSDVTGIDKLIGMSKGFSGSDQGGILTNQLRDNPYSVVLLDEIEKAHPNILNLFLQAFDEGWITDGHGKRVYLSDAIIVMTSNLGSENFKRLTNPMGFGLSKEAVNLVASLVIKEFKTRFPSEFRNRIDEVIVFSPLTAIEIQQIAKMYLEEIRRVMLLSGKELIYEEAVGLLSQKGFSLEYGARFLKRTVDKLVKVPVTIQWNRGSRFVVETRNEDIVITAEELGEAAVV